MLTNYHVQYTVIIEKEKGRGEKEPRSLEYPGLVAGVEILSRSSKVPRFILNAHQNGQFLGCFVGNYAYDLHA